MVEVKGFCPRDYMKLLTGSPLYFHINIITYVQVRLNADFLRITLSK
uniref:Uncharacterized protein n=1 Tax=Siphoviridae sp. ctb3910 TaxID=2827897 RepID=A0A8S5S975_9CAUD|nr:MAG TPA: hypothetical protein [Siphoviridae sp. ctb3910]